MSHADPAKKMSGLRAAYSRLLSFWPKDRFKQLLNSLRSAMAHIRAIKSMDDLRAAYSLLLSHWPKERVAQIINRRRSDVVHVGDAEYMSDLRAAYFRPPKLSASLLLGSIILFFIWALFWSRSAMLDEVTNGIGQVIPSGDVQAIQNLEGGIVAEILVRQGEVVGKNQVLLRIDDTQFRSKQLEDKARYLGFLAASARLKAEINNTEPVFPEELSTNYAHLVKREIELSKSRSKELTSSKAVLKNQLEQKQQEIVELNSRIKQLSLSRDLAYEELAITEPLVKSGASSRIELIRLKRGISDIDAEINAATESLPRARSAQAEAERRIDEQLAMFRSKALTELSEVEINISALKEVLASAKDRVARTDVRSPVAGIVKQIHVNTIGGVIKPGMDLVLIVPQEDNLLVKARIRPSDIAFLHPGQKVKVKITAYDYTIYGTLDAELEQISADSITDENGESFFEIQVRTRQSYLSSKGKPLPIIPGMQAEVDVLTGKKTVYEYLMKPILRAQQKALRER